MRRTVLSSIVFMSLTALSVVIGACATAPVDDDLSGLTQEQNPASPEEGETASSKLPPASNPSKDETPPADAGSGTTTKDAGTTTKDAGTTTKDAGTSPPTTSDDCDATDPLYFLKLALASNPTSCPCSASECCYATAVCLPK